MNNIENRYDRKKIYEEVWKESMTKVSARYNLSYNGMKKLCHDMRIPTPWKGYWAELKAGKKITIPKLPEYSDEDKKENVLNEKLKQYNDSIFLNEQEITEIVDACYSIKTNRPLSNPCPLTKQVIRCYSKVTIKPSDLMRPYFWKQSKTIGVKVTNTSLERALFILDVIIKSLYRLGYTAKSSPEKDHIIININKEQIRITISEHVKATRHKATPEEKKEDRIPAFDYSSTNELIFSFSVDYRVIKKWKDSNKCKIEDSLEDILLSLIHASYIIKHHREEERLETEQRCKEEVQRYEDKEQQEEETKRFDELKNEAIDWYLSEIIENYVRSVECRVKNMHRNSVKKAEMIKWVNWARGKAEWLNPLVAKNDPILGKRHNRK